MEGYNTERDNTAARLDEYVKTASASKLENVAVLCGLGNHGGGPTRRHLADIRAWAKAHPEVRVIHSGLHRFFAALRAELRRKGAEAIPVHRGEVQHWARGCYSSVAKFKYLYRSAENMLSRAEKTSAMVSALTRRPGMSLEKAWDGILFNTFHDILPGSSIERAFDDQMAWLGLVIHTTQSSDLRALTALAARIDTRVITPPPDHPTGVSVLVWNPHPHPFKGPIEIEASIDYRPIWSYRDRAQEVPLRLLDAQGKAIPFQEIATEHSALPDLPWRKRVLTQLALPAFGWNVLELGWVEGAKIPVVKNPVKSGPDFIENEYYRVEARTGDDGIRLFHRGRSVFADDGLTAAVLADHWGCWGGMAEEKESVYFDDVREKWKVTDVKLLERGSERAALWVRLSGKKSRLDLSLFLCRGREAVDVSARVFWDERSARLKLIFPVGDEAEYEVPGAIQKRKPGGGEEPGGRWVRVGAKTSGGFGFASDALYNFECRDGKFNATVVRATRYANDQLIGPDEEIWRPAVDAGELRFHFLMAPGSADLPKLAMELEQPPMVHLAVPKKGELPRCGSLASLSPDSLQLLALKPSEDGRDLVVRVQAPAGKRVSARLTWFGKTIVLGTIKGGQIASWRLFHKKSGWKAKRVDVAERG